MELIADIRETFVSSPEEDATYRCVDCYAEYDEHKHLCRKCGGERFTRA